MRSTTNPLQVLRAAWVTSRAYSADYRCPLRWWAAVSYFVLGLLPAVLVPHQTIWQRHHGGHAVLMAAHPTATTRPHVRNWITVTVPVLAAAFVALVVLSDATGLLLPTIGWRTEVITAVVGAVVVTGPPLASMGWPIVQRHRERSAMKAWTRELRDTNPAADIVTVGQLAAWPHGTGAGIHLLNEVLADRVAAGQVLVGVARNAGVLALYQARTTPPPVSHPEHPCLIRWGGNPAPLEAAHNQKP